MSLVNICRDNHDPFYRYKMPLIQAKREGKGNGIKTNVLNAVEVARALARPTNYVIKYFGFELGAQTSIDEKNERYLINGLHEPDKLQDTLDGFINKFVLCPECKNPETVLEITKDEKLQRDCKACGKITFVDPRLKLVTYIMKNPPKKEKTSKKSATASANVVGGGKSIADIAAKQLSTDSNQDDNNNNSHKKIVVNDDDWAVDMSEEAIKARAKELESLNIGADKQKYEDFGKWFLAQEDYPEDIEIFKKAQELNILKDRQTVEVLAQVIFDEDIIEEIEEHKGLLSKLVTSDKHEKSLLGGIERMIGTQHIDLVSKVPKILMILYDNDLLSEEVIKDWGTHVSKKYVSKDVSKTIRKAAKPFLQWLDEADEESEDDSE